MIAPKDKGANDGLPGQDQLILVYKLPIWHAEELWPGYKKRSARLADAEQHQSQLPKRHNPR
jgi:hypothetical protein